MVPTVAVVEATFGDAKRDAAANRRLKTAHVEPLSMNLARDAARLRSTRARHASAADAAVAATALRRDGAVVLTRADLGALCEGGTVRVVVV